MGYMKVNEDRYIATFYSQAFSNKFLTVKFDPWLLLPI